MLALIAGQGALPGILHDRLDPDPLICELEGFSSGLPDPVVFRLETLGTFFRTLSKRGVTEVCFAGAIRRPRIEPTRIDMRTVRYVPRMVAAMGQGDDAALRVALSLFEENGFAVRGIGELLPELLPSPGIPTRAQPSDRDKKDVLRAAEIHSRLSELDISQGCIVAAGQALAVETLGGTDWMLESIAGDRRPPSRDGGLLFKAAKPGQDRRVDLPVIGTDTVEKVAAAGLSGLVIEAGGVMVIDFPATIAAADAAGLFLWVRDP